MQTFTINSTSAAPFHLSVNQNPVVAFSAREAIQAKLVLELAQPTQRVAQHKAGATLAKRFATLVGSASPNDVVFYFPRSNRELWANSAILKQASSYFRTLLDSGLKESVPSSIATHLLTDSHMDDDLAGDSDDETDKVPLKLATTRFKASLPPGVKEIVVKSATYTTYRAVLVYLHSGYIDFAKLRGNPKSPVKDALAASTAATATDPQLPLPASPKSLYALAHLLELPVLMRLALDNFKSQLTVDNVLYQVISEVAVHDEVRGAVTSFAKANWAAVKAGKSAEELAKVEVVEALGCGAREIARMMELVRQC